MSKLVVCLRICALLLALTAGRLLAEEGRVLPPPQPYASLDETMQALNAPHVSGWGDGGGFSVMDEYGPYWFWLIDDSRTALDALLTADATVDPVLLRAASASHAGEPMRARAAYLLALRGDAMAGEVVRELAQSSDRFEQHAASQIVLDAVDVAEFRRQIDPASLDNVTRIAFEIRAEQESARQDAEASRSASTPGQPPDESAEEPARESDDKRRAMQERVDAALHVARNCKLTQKERVAAIRGLSSRDALSCVARILDLVREDLPSGDAPPRSAGDVAAAGVHLLYETPGEEALTAIEDLALDPLVDSANRAGLRRYLAGLLRVRLGVHLHTIEFLRWHVRVRRLRGRK